MNIAPYIEHTRLNATITEKDVDNLIKEAVDYRFLGICVPPFWVKRARREINSEHILLITVAGFPMGYHMTETKSAEAARALDDGADEIDVVWNLSSFKTGHPWTKIELAKLSGLAHDRRKKIKVIIETAYLSNDEIMTACRMCADAGADFVKTSTGFSPEGATAEHVQLMRETLPGTVGIKAAGGITTYAQAVSLIGAGADRIGTSSGVSIIKQATNQS